VTLRRKNGLKDIISSLILQGTEIYPNIEDAARPKKGPSLRPPSHTHPDDADSQIAPCENDVLKDPDYPVGTHVS
jgi:hypothetical protein